MHRCNFLLSTLSAGTLIGLGTYAQAIDPIVRKGGAHLKLSIAAYSYRDYLTGKKSPT